MPLATSAAALTLEAESGFSLDPTLEITAFRDNILSGRWQDVEALLKREHLRSLEQADLSHLLNPHLHTSSHSRRAWISKSTFGVESEVLNVGFLYPQPLDVVVTYPACTSYVQMARFLVAQQKYLEFLELGQAKKALMVLRSELAPLASPHQIPSPDVSVGKKPPISPIDSSLNKLTVATTFPGETVSEWPSDEDQDPGVQRLCLLSSLMMCGNLEEICKRAAWDGIGRGSRIRLLEDLQGE